MAGGKGSNAPEWGRLIFRMIVGGGMMTHGWPKVFGVTDAGVRNIVGFTQYVAKIGFPYPNYFAWAAALSELVGGAMLILGFGTRVAAFGIACTMAVAAWTDRAGGWKEMELAALYLAPALFLLLGGPGKKSLDAIYFTRKSG